MPADLFGFGRQRERARALQQMELEDLKRQREATRLRALMPLFAEREFPGPEVDSRGLMRMGDLNAAAQEPVLVRGREVYAPEQLEGGTTFPEMTTTYDELGRPRSTERTYTRPRMTGGEFLGREPVSAEPGPAPNTQDIPDFSGLGRQTLRRRPTPGEVLTDPATPGALLPDVLARGPELTKLMRQGRVQDAMAKFTQDREANPDQDPVALMTRHFGPLAENTKEFEDIISPMARLLRERSAEKREVTREAGERRKTEGAEVIRKRQEEADAYMREQAATLDLEGDAEGARMLRLGRFEDKRKASEYAQLVRTRLRETGAAARTDVRETGQDRRQAERLAAYERGAQATRASRLEVQRQGFENDKAVLDHREKIRAGRPDAKLGLRVADQLLLEREQLRRQIESERRLIEAAQYMPETETRTSEHKAAILGFEARIADIDRQRQQLHRDARTGGGTATPQPGRPLTGDKFTKPRAE